MEIEQFWAGVVRRFPQLAEKRGAGLRLIEAGWDSRVLEVGEEYIFRFPRRPETLRQVQKEIALLPELSRWLSLPVPQFTFVWQAPGEEDWQESFVGYRKLDGDAIQAWALEKAAVSAQLARFLSELHAYPRDRIASLPLPRYTTDQWRTAYADFYTWLQHHALAYLSTQAKMRATDLWQGFLGDHRNFQFQPALIHGDLSPEHILFDPSSMRISGIIDWEDACLGDPALDFAGLFTLVGSAALDAILPAYTGEKHQNLYRRTAFYASIVPFHAMRFGLETGSEAILRRGITVWEEQR